MDTNELRKKFLEFFEEKGHTAVHSSPTVPFDDPTLLFANAGMNQFKDYFLAKANPPYTRATTSQKCVRVGGKHNDLDNVGHTKRHLTFFEMLGNFSFGDYFKEDAIGFAVELSQKLGIDFDRVVATVFREDEESFALWKEYLPENRIVRMGEKDNFWSMGEAGPCGPCTELYYDLNPKPITRPIEEAEMESGRFFEYWNVVFMQYSRSPGESDVPLLKPCVDTGMGLERMLLISQNVGSVFETDVLRSLIGVIEKLSHKRYDPEEELAPSFHVIADHLRSLAFTISDGAAPASTDRGYVLRKLVRRAVRYGRNLGFDAPFLHHLVDPLRNLMGDHYQELSDSSERIKEILTAEEDAFFRTLNRGQGLFQRVLDTAKTTEMHQISGEDAFKLKDTYGFPLDEILLLAKHHHLTVNPEP